MKKTFLLLAVTISLIYSCSSDDSNPEVDIPDDNPTTEKNVLLSEDTTHGKYLTDASGMTLYFFSNDSKMTSECIEGCLDAWPVFYESNLELDNVLESNDFGTITRKDGAKQTTYKGWPLYYYVGDNSKGDINGDGVNQVWYVAKPDYSVMYVNAQLVGNDGVNYIIDNQGDIVEGEGKTLYLTDSEGNTLYAYAPDKNDTNTYTSEDFSNDGAWPIFYNDLKAVPSVLKSSDFNVITVHGKKDQITFKGWPLYYFGSDNSKGDNKGVSVPNPGVWPVLNNATEVAPE
ncbi:MAG: hypothetical protein HWD89_02700 [Tenacibaculum sp.]|uniref:hypothetical protein n=1 Tax=Tenacibaculum sp. TaxID=1906242 RepID=UPI001842F59D|nr:hypothetical protein [Tenacibaculum sp.]NVK07933.1 hypothetical protein [Tenacibaculum sp.]